MHKVLLKCVKASEDHEWNLKLGELAMIWRGLYHSRSILTKIKDAYDNNSELQNLLLIRFKNICN